MSSRTRPSEMMFSEKTELIGDSRRIVQFIKCSHPGCTEEFKSPLIAKRKPEHFLIKTAIRKDWQFNERKKTAFCPKHGDRKVNTPAPHAQKVSAPREATPADRRRIFKEIDECYDVANNRYISGFSDKVLADKLKLPWAWIAEQREKNFGPAGPDMRIIKAEEDIKALMSKVEDYETAAYKLIDMIDNIKKEVARIAKHVEGLK